MKILCVDDDAFVRLALKRTFQSSYEVVAVASAFAAIEQLAVNEFAVVVTDYSMSGMTGLELVERLRERDNPARVIVVTGAFADPVLLARLNELGVLCLPKPFQTAQLRQAVQTALDEYKARRAVGSGGGGDASADEGLVRRIRRIAGQLRAGNDLPSIDPRAVDLVKRCRVQVPEIEELTAVVSGDPILAMQAIALINSAGFFGARRVTDVREACLRLGSLRLVGMVQELLVKRAIRVDRGPLAAAFDTMWKCARMTADLAADVATQMGDPNPAEVYLAALLHNVGELLVCYRAALEFHEVDSAVLTAVGRLCADEHEAIGEKILRSWRMPRTVWVIAGQHHNALEDGTPLLQQRRRVIMQAWSAAVGKHGEYLPGLAVARELHAERTP
jgi:HD-like signal output (HDOD) protein/CheY-like chemotaxis protein